MNVLRMHVHIVGICIFIKFITICTHKTRRYFSYKNTPDFTSIQLVWLYYRSISFQNMQEKQKTRPVARATGRVFLLHIHYSVRRATTGSFFAAEREGMMPANMVSSTLMTISAKAVTGCRIASKFGMPVR